MLDPIAFPCRWTQVEQMVQYRLYRARDTQLHTMVALKLVEHFRPAAHELDFITEVRELLNIVHKRHGSATEAGLETNT